MIVVLTVLLIIGPTIYSSLQDIFQPDPRPTPTRPSPPPTPLPPPPPPNRTGETTGPRLDQWPEDPNPPELVYPRTEADLSRYLDSNPLYDQGLEPVPCTVGSIDLTTASADQIDDYMTSLVACLMDAWDDAVYAAGYRLPRPSVTVYQGDFTTKCGQAPARNAFYCGADQQLYYSIDLIELFSYDLRQARFVAEAVVAHEFAHAVQGRTGILTSEAYRQDKANDVDEQQLWSRRVELQADCFAGLFFHTIDVASGLTEMDRVNATAVFYQLGDPPEGGDHGQSDSRADWFNAGVGTNQVGVCQTFTVPANSVR